MSRVASLAKIPRAWTVREAAALLDLHPKKVQRLIHAQVLRGFTQHSYRRIPVPPFTLRRTRLYVSSAEVWRYIHGLEAAYAEELGRRQRRRADSAPARRGARTATGRMPAVADAPGGP
jgi:hypothetical protein